MHLITLKLHVLFALLSLLLFTARATFAFKKPEWVNNRWLHFSVLGCMGMVLLTAIALCVFVGMYPLTDGWLTEKTIGLFAYIGFGIWAIRPSLQGAPRAFLVSASVMMFVLSYVIAKHHMPIILPL